MATTSGSGDWFNHFYQPTTSSTMIGTSPSESTVVSTTNYTMGGSASSEHVTAAAAAPGRLSPAQEGRVSRPARRRSRASRRNPTTLLNTDTTNFRAMVQRYTGGAGTYQPFDSPVAFNLPGGTHQAPMYSFGQHSSAVPGMTSSPSMIDTEAAHLRQRLLQQYNVAAPREVEEEAFVSVGGRSDHSYSSAMGGDGENRRSGFMF